MLTRNEIVQKLKELKRYYANEGIAVIGFFGSYARGDATENSDLDVLIETQESFVSDADPLQAFTRLREIKEHLQQVFHMRVDLADKSGLNSVASRFILNELYRV